MPDPRFYRRAGPYTLTDLAAMAGAQICGDADPSYKVHDIAQLSDATAEQLVYVTDARYLDAWAESRCGACITSDDLAEHAPRTCRVLLAPDPRKAFAVIAAAFYPSQAPVAQHGPIAADAAIGKNVSLAPGVVIGAGAEIGDNVVIGANTVIGPGVAIGSDSRLEANVSVIFSFVGARAVIHAGVRIGQDGFGFVPSAGGLKKVPQLGRVIIHDDVEIGANTTIDRGAIGDTVIGAGTKIDNLVQIGHNVVIGRHCVIVAQAGISGSCRLGDGVILGGQVGLASHLHIGDGAQVAAQSGLMRDVGPGEAVMGYPAKPVRRFWREVAALSRLTKRNKGP